MTTNDPFTLTVFISLPFALVIGLWLAKKLVDFGNKHRK